MTIQPSIQPDTQPDVQNDARRRTDEYNREYVATEVGQPSSMSNGKPEAGVSKDLLQKLEKSAQTLRHSAESIENRGSKLLLKVMAQERVSMSNALRQAMGREKSDPLDSAHESSTNNLQYGLQDIQSSMTVQRQGREKVVLTQLIEEEDSLLAAYSANLERTLADSIRDELERQRAHVAQFRSRANAVVEGVEPVVARVFDTRIEGEIAITRLREQGLDASQIDAAPITRLISPVLNTSEVRSSPKNTMVAGAFSGGIVGGIVGLALAAFVWLAPQLVGWVTVGPWALLIGAIVIGAVFGSVFGLLIGQNQREDDFAVTADGLINGEILVVAYPQPHQVPMVEDVLQTHHAREQNR